MDMRLQRTSIVPETPCGSCRSHFTVEGDVTLPGSLRETTEVLHATAVAVTERAEALQERVSLGGRVVFCVIYTQGGKPQAHSIEATADFSHLCDLPGAVPKAEVWTDVQARQVEASVQNGRMTLRAEIHLYARAAVNEPLEAATAVELPDVQTRSAQVTMRKTVARGKADVLLREEFSLPAELDIHDTLGAWARVDAQDVSGGEGRIGLSGEMMLEVLHASDLPGRPLVTTRYTVPVSQSVEISGEAGEVLDGRMTIKDVAVVSQEIGDGERALRAEILLGLEAWAEREETLQVLQDAYTTSGEDILLSRKPVTFRSGGNHLRAAESGKAQILLPDGSKPIRTMLAAFVHPVLNGFSQQGSRLMTEGRLETTLLYMTDDSDAPVSLRMEVPFRAAFALSAAPEDVVHLSAANAEAVPVTSDRAELRYILHAEVDGLRTAMADVVTELSVVPGEPLNDDIILYYAQPGETAWEIARRYRIPESQLRELNPDMPDDPATGRGLLIWRKSVNQ